MKIEVVKVVEAPVSEAWPVFSDFEGLDGLVPDMTLVVSGRGPGAVRTATDSEGRQTSERLEALDNDRHVFGYSVITEADHVPFTNYQATVRLQALTDQTTEVRWSGEFEPKGLPEDQLRSIITAGYGGVIGFLASKLNAKVHDAGQ